MKIIAAIEAPKVIRKILKHMDLATKPPPLYPARGPTKTTVVNQKYVTNFKN
tara:strand:+ start:1339 stop:1494 length:156 start_codon:yes stop_codon:yes gene_type:complete